MAAGSIAAQKALQRTIAANCMMSHWITQLQDVTTAIGASYTKNLCLTTARQQCVKLAFKMCKVDHQMLRYYAGMMISHTVANSLLNAFSANGAGKLHKMLLRSAASCCSCTHTAALWHMSLGESAHSSTMIGQQMMYIKMPLWCCCLFNCCDETNG